MNISFFKNYYLIFLINYFFVLITKIIFLIYLTDYFSNYTLSTQLYAILWGYRFDFAISAFVTFVITLFDFNKHFLISSASLAMLIILSFQISDMMYFNEATRHISYEISDIFVDSYSLLMTAISQHTLVMILSAIFIPILLLYCYRFFSTVLIKISVSKYYVIQKIILLLITIFFMRGTNLVGIAINPYQASQIGDAKLSALSLNGAYSIMYYVLNQKDSIQAVSLPNMAQIDVEKNLTKLYSSQTKINNIKIDRPNIILFFLESWSATHIKSYGFEEQTTPFFDDILTKSIRPKAMIAGGHRTSEGIFTTLTSIQNPLGKTVAKTRLQNYQYHSMLDIFNQDNYYSAFYQGSSKETSGVGSFAQKLGFKYSFGKRDITKRKYNENAWGVHDPDLYNFIQSNLTTKTQPFVIGINGATTHDDKIPNSINEIKFSDNTKLNNNLNALHFSDQSLAKFVNDMKQKYPNTLFVFFADHVGGISGNSFENYLIPFAIYHQDLAPQYYDEIISQRDIAPTILDLVYQDYKKIMPNVSGKSLLSDNEFFADYYHSGILGWVKNKKLLELNLLTQKSQCYSIKDWNLVDANCTKEFKIFADEALAFTVYSQQLLFSGITKKFNTIRSKL